MTDDRLLDALEAVVFYNGLGEIISEWAEIKPDRAYKQILTPDICWKNDQLQMIWMIAVIMFGNYGTSPRGGWIENVEGFRDYCKRITRTHREEIALKEQGMI